MGQPWLGKYAPGGYFAAMPSATVPVHASPELAIRVRLMVGSATVMGPGKAELLGHIRDSGSISEAAKRMGMSYNRAWLHVKIMNEAFLEPVVESLRGGANRGGASLTAHGEKVLTAYQQMYEETEKASVKAQRKLLKLLKSE